MTAYFIAGVQILSSSFVSRSEQRIRLNIFYISKLNIQTRLAVPLYYLVIEPSPAHRVSGRRWFGHTEVYFGYLFRILRARGCSSGYFSLYRAGVSNSNWSVGQMGSYKVIRGPHCDAEATIAVPECTRSSFYILFPAKRVMNYRQIISSRQSHSY